MSEALDYRSRIVRDPAICGGIPIIKGTRVPLRTVLACLAHGDSIEEIVEDYPSLCPDDVRAAIASSSSSPRRTPSAGQAASSLPR